MSLNFALVLKADAGQAKAELRNVQAEVTKTGAAAKVLATEAKGAGAGLDMLGADARGAATGLDAISAKAHTAEAALQTLVTAQTRVATTSTTMAQNNVKAAGSVGNLVSQFNDIGVMLMAGQSPLQLAIQQGTQITQVIGPMGAAGAVRALGAGLLSMLSPINLITIGVIAFGAAAIQWLTGAGEKAVTTADRIEDLSKAVDTYTASAKAAYAPSADLTAQYGNMAKTAKEALEAIAAADRAKALGELKSAQSSIAGGFGGFDTSTSDIIGSQYEETLANIRRELGLTGEDALAVAKKLDALGQANGPAEIARAALAAREALIAAGQAADSELAVSLATTAQKALELAAAFEPTKAAIDAAKGKTAELVGLANDLVTAIQTAGAGDLSGPFSRALPAARGLLGIASQIATYARGLGAIANFNRDSLADSKTYSGRGGDPRDFMAGGKLSSTPFKYNGPSLDSNNNPTIKGGGGGGAKAVKEETSAIADLITKMREEADLTRETDPVKKALLQNRKALAGATEAERAEVEQLIRAEQQLKSVRAAEDYANQSVLSALDLIGQKGKTLNDILNSVVSSLIQVAKQALITGQGPLAGLLGISGGLFSGSFGGGGGTGSLGLPMPFADGGLITGAGGPREDRIHIRASAGETIMNGKASARWRPVLERMNAGSDAPGFADGGFIGGRSGSSSGRGGDIINNITVNNPTGNSEIRDMVKQGLSESMKRYDRDVLPSRVKTIFSENARVTG